MSHAEKLYNFYIAPIYSTKTVENIIVGVLRNSLNAHCYENKVVFLFMSSLISDMLWYKNHKKAQRIKHHDQRVHVKSDQPTWTLASQ